MPPLTKTCPKMVLSIKGVAFLTEDVFAKNFLVPGEIPLAARSHQFFGNTLLKAGHLMRLSVVSGTVRGLALQGGHLPPRFRTIQGCPKDLRALPVHSEPADSPLDVMTIGIAVVARSRRECQYRSERSAR